MPSSPISRFYQELKRRKVIRVAIVYALVAWIVVEVASVMFPGLLLPEWSVRLVIGLAVIGFPIALVLAWALELTPDGLKMDSEAGNVACSNMVGGNTERALDLLEEHAKASVIQLDWLEKDSDWDAARDHPRFLAIVESLRSE